MGNNTGLESESQTMNSPVWHECRFVEGGQGNEPGKIVGPCRLGSESWSLSY